MGMTFVCELIAYLLQVVTKLAAVYNLPVETVAAVTSGNARRLFLND